MAPKVKISKEKIIEAAISLIRNGGVEAVNARTLAATLGCSTQPIFSNFETMEALQNEVLARAHQIYMDFLKNEAERKQAETARAQAEANRANAFALLEAEAQEAAKEREDAFSEWQAEVEEAEEAHAQAFNEWQSAAQEAEEERANAFSLLENEVQEEIEKTNSAANRANTAAETLESANKLFSNALIGSTTGAAVRIDDASPIEHDMAVKVSGVDDVSAVKVLKTGLNLWDEQWELGTIVSSGKNVTSTNTIRSKNYIPVKAGIKLYLYAPQMMRVIYYDTNKAQYNYIYPDSGVTLTPKQDGYIRFAVGGDVGSLAPITEYANNICISVYNEAVNGTYEAYKQEIYTVNADGTVDGVKPLQPTTTLLTDTTGAIIDAEYNKDVNAVESRVKNIEDEVTKQYELIEEITIDEAVASFKRDIDTSGNAYDFSAIRVRVQAPVAEGAQSASQIIFDLRGENNALLLYHQTPGGLSPTSEKVTHLIARNDHGLLDYYVAVSDVRSNANMVTKEHYVNTPWTNVVSIRLITYPNTVLIPAGTKITIYGVRG